MERGTAGTEPGVTYSQFTCVGTGFSGIGLASTLKRWYGITDVRFFEREGDVGGTWLLNSYPGAASDVPNLLYCYSFEPAPEWTKVLPERDALWAYLRSVADKYDVPSKTSFHSEVYRCEWIDSRKRWRTTARSLKDGSDIIHESQFLYTAVGIFDKPRGLDLPGVDTFQGEIFHTARWRHDVDLTDKNVVVFGNGCTGAQVVPAIAPKCKSLTQIVRSKHWIVPSIKEKSVAPLKKMQQYVPGGGKLARYLMYNAAEAGFEGMYMDEKGAKFREKQQKFLTSYMKKKAPEKYHDLLIPDFEYGCKRRVFDSGYLDCLHRDNVTLTNAKPKEVKPTHLLMDDGQELKADVIVLANGFETSGRLYGVNLLGRNGTTLRSHWDDLGGPGAYQTCAMSDFPNFFMIVGPNCVVGHTSALMVCENVINLSLRQIKPVLDGHATAVEPSWEAEYAHVQQVQKDLMGRVWNAGCNGWYVMTDKMGKVTWNSANLPYSQAAFWWRCLFPTKGDWVYSDYEGSSGVTTGRLFAFGVLLGLVGILARR